MLAYGVKGFTLDIGEMNGVERTEYLRRLERQLEAEKRAAGKGQ